MEEWKWVPEFEGRYEISNKGNLRRHAKGVIIPCKVYKDPRGYKQVALGHKTIRWAHRVVALAFIPNPLNRPVVNHIDGDPSNNSVENLEWVTAKQNMLHAYRTGLVKKKHARGEDTHRSPLKNRDVLEIRRLYKEDGTLTYKALGDRYGVGEQTVYRIVNRFSWTHI